MDWPNFNSFAVISLRFQDADVGFSGRLRKNALDHGTDTGSCTGGDYMELTNLREKIGFNVREYRLGRGYSQGVLAELCGLNHSYIGIDNLERLSLGLAVPPVELLEISTAGLDDGTPNEQAITEISSVVVLSRKRFFELLKQCAVHRPDLVAICLDRCGVRVVK